MCKQMILTVFVIALALGAETEFQRRIVKLRPAADSGKGTEGLTAM